MDKIAVFLSNYLNSSETFIYERLVNFTKLKPIVLSYRTGNLDRFPYSPVYSLHGESSFLGAVQRTLMANFGFCPYFEKIAKDNDVRLVQAHFAARALEIRWLSKKMNIPQVNFFHGSDLDAFKGSRSGTIAGLVGSTALSVTVSAAMKKDLVKLGCDERKLIVNYAGIDLAKFSFTPRSVKRSEEIKLLMCGRLNWKKGFEFGIEAFASVLKNFPNLRLDIIGDGELKSALTNRISALGLSGKIFMSGELPPAEIPGKMRDADILLVPSLSEGLPNVIKEAMASGLPVITTNVGGIPEMVRDGENGFLVESRSPDGMASKVVELIENTSVYEKFSRSGRRTVEEDFDVRKQMGKIETIYTEMIDSWKK